jgi:hypothetical protein
MRQALGVCVLAVATLLGCGALLAAAVLTPAPLPIVPLLLLVCLGCPMALGWSLPGAVAVLRRRGQVLSLRRELARLPEAPHPHGF